MNYTALLGSAVWALLRNKMRSLLTVLGITSSGGQQQRVAIARALVNRPSILLADRPTGNLDSHTSVEIMEVFQDLNEKGLTIVMVTHEPDIAQFARRTVVFKDGTIRKDEPVIGRLRAHEVLETLPALEA